MNYYNINNEPKTIQSETSAKEYVEEKSVMDKVSERAKRIVKSEGLKNMLDRNKISTPAMFIGVGVGVIASIKYKKSLILMSILGAALGLAVGNILLRNKIVNNTKIKQNGSLDRKQNT